ncbi:hypothetical protein BDI4_190139 [Burkholderia diffusa]|uniref:hypothetical protein n=1 Tax=Burkholderia diffusa TaxID=488732 RepID=UPI001CABF713|nr:hypothetical protein [Burkholderia diffusa]CAG9246218.1 hypothetical protein BDI4_190139 [Burkholderia diffusa]
MGMWKREVLAVGARRYIREESETTGARWYYVIRSNGRRMMLDARHHVIKALIDCELEKRAAGEA